MTIRAVALGLLGAALIAAAAYFNDIVMRQTYLVTSYMPLFIYGAVIIFVTTVNPLLKRIDSRVAFRGSEILTIVAIMLPSCYVSSRALIHRFSGHVMAANYMNPAELGWRRRHLLERVPTAMIARVPAAYEAAHLADAQAVCRGLAGEGGRPARPGEKALRAALGPDDRAAIEAALASNDDRECAAVAARALNRVMPRRDLFAAADFEGVTLPKEAGRLFAAGEEIPDHKVRRLNRELMDLTYGDLVTSYFLLEERAVTGFQMGLGEKRGGIGFFEVPWYAWKKTLWFWIPLITAFCAVFMGLALVAHRQWSDHELYPYPIVMFARSLMPEQKAGAGGLLRNRTFWITVSAIALLHFNNYAYLYWPESLVEIPRRFDFRPIVDHIPVLRRGGAYSIFSPTIYFTAIGLAYFMANDVSLSMGIAPYVYAVIAGVFAGYGVSLSGGWYNSLRTDIFIAAGAYFGLFAIIVYTGRYHYASVLKGTFLFRREEDVRPHEKLGAWISVVASLVFIIMCVAVGIRLRWAVLYLLMLIMIFAPLGRIVAETGLFVVHPHIYPTVLLWGFVGTRILGPQQMLLMFIIGAMFALGMHMNVLPLFDHGLKLTGECPRRTAGFAGAGVVIALLVAIPVAIYLQYNLGYMSASDGWNKWIPRFPFDPVVSIEDRLEAQGVLGEAGNAPAGSWLGAISPHWPGVVAFVVTIGLMFAAEALRLRTRWWPIHPLLFVCAGWWHSQVLGASFLIGWAIKRSITKFGGTAVYNRLRPVMFGLIAGDMLSGCVLTIIGAIYYLVTGTPPNSTWIIPA